MQYYVLGENGQKYGPADVSTLNEWIKQSRLWPENMLEDAATGVQSAAKNVPGLTFKPATPVMPPSVPPSVGGLPQQPPVPGSYGRPQQPQSFGSSPAYSSRSATAGGKEWKQALSAIGLCALAIPLAYFAGIGLFICIIPGLKLGYEAITEDENWFGLLGILLGIVAIIVYVMHMQTRFSR